MPLTRLEFNHIRNLQRVQIDPGSTFNLIYGSNGSGKSSFLEGIHLLGLGRSFRTLINHKLISMGQTSSSSFGRLSSTVENRPEDALGIQKSTEVKTLVKINGEQAKSAAVLAEYLPLQLITPDAIDLVAGSAKNRRQFIDWGVFHVEHQFIEQWRMVQRQLKQRNALLKSASQGTTTDSSLLTEISIWDKQLLSSSEAVNAARNDYLANLRPFIIEFTKIFLPDLDLQVSYYSGWPKSLCFKDALAAALQKDLKQGFTFYSPNRADIKLKTQNQAVSDVLSRGQMKLLVCALKLAQARLLAEQKGIQSIFLIDDLAAELDIENRAKLCAALDSIGSQVFITSVDKDSIIKYLPSTSCKVFHVEHGKVSLEASFIQQ